MADHRPPTIASRLLGRMALLRPKLIRTCDLDVPPSRLAVLVPKTLPSIQSHVDVGLHAPSTTCGISEITLSCEILKRVSWLIWDTTQHAIAHLGHNPAIGWKHLKTNPCMETLENHAHSIWKFLKTRLPFPGISNQSPIPWKFLKPQVHHGKPPENPQRCVTLHTIIL